MTEPGLTDFTVRAATRDDIPRISHFLRPFVAEKKILERTEDELVELWVNGFIAERDDELLGFAALEVFSSKLAEIRSLAVGPQHQGQGIGKRLVDACLERARERRILEVMVITSSEQFFRSCGFEFTLPGEKKALFFQTRDD